MVEALHQKVFEKMLADKQRYPALSLLYAANLKNPLQTQRAEISRRRFLRVSAGALALPYVALAGVRERAGGIAPLPKDEVIPRAFYSHIGLSLAHLARNATDWARFMSAAGALERMKQKVLFTNLPEKVKEGLLPQAELVEPSFKSGRFPVWGKDARSFAADAIGTGAGLTAALHSLAFIAGVPRAGFELSALASLATAGEAATYAGRVHELNKIFSEKRLDGELSRLHGIVREVEGEGMQRPKGRGRRR